MGVMDKQWRVLEGKRVREMKCKQEGKVQLEVGVLEARRSKGERGISNLGLLEVGAAKGSHPRGDLI